MTVEMKPLPNDLIDALLADYKKPEDSIGQNSLSKQLTKALVERALQAEMTDHLGHGKSQLVANEVGNIRNGRNKKTLKGSFAALCSFDICQAVHHQLVQDLNWCSPRKASFGVLIV